MDAAGFKRWFGKSKVVDSSGEPKVVYHGSPAYFEEFDVGLIGSGNGTGEGYGFYFTDNYEFARGYANGSENVMSIYLRMEHPMTLTQRKLNRTKWKALLLELYRKNPDALANYGDVSYEGLTPVLNLALDLLLGSDNDLDILHDIINSGLGSYVEIMGTFRKLTGYDGVIEKAGPNTIYVVFLPDQILQVKKVRTAFRRLSLR